MVSWAGRAILYHPPHPSHPRSEECSAAYSPTYSAPYYFARSPARVRRTLSSFSTKCNTTHPVYKRGRRVGRAVQPDGDHERYLWLADRRTWLHLLAGDVHRTGRIFSRLQKPSRRGVRAVYQLVDAVNDPAGQAAIWELRESGTEALDGNELISGERLEIHLR